MNKTKFFIRFVVALTVLFVVWIPIAEIFENIKNTTACFFFELITGRNLTSQPTSYVIGAMTNIVTFTALILATTKINLEKRIKVIIVGIIILFFLEIFTINVYVLLKSNIGGVIENFMHGIGMVIFPVALWIVMLYKDIFPKKVEQKEKGYMRVMKELYSDVSKEKYCCPICKKEYEDIIGHLKSKHKKKMRSRKVKEFLKKHHEIKI